MLSPTYALDRTRYVLTLTFDLQLRAIFVVNPCDKFEADTQASSYKSYAFGRE